MNKILKQIIILIILITVLVLPYFVFASESVKVSYEFNMKDVLERTGRYGGYDTSDTSGTQISSVVGTVVKAFLSLLGVIFIVLIILAGYKWMNAGGNEEQLTESKESIKRAIIGLVIIVGAYAIWNVIWYNLLN